jgi:sugar phosphate isomerase/epimerase
MIRNSFTRRDFIACAAAASAAASVAPRLLAESSRPRVGCQVNGFAARTGDFSQLISVLPTIKSLGYAGFECNNHFVLSELDHPADARAKIRASGLEFIGMHTSMAEAEKNDLGRLARGGAALGCHNIVMSAAGLSKDGNFTPDALKEKVATLEKYGRICNSAGMKLAYHNHMPEFANGNAEIQALADHSDPALLSFLIDAGHAYQGGGDPADFMRRNSHRIVGCHIKTFKNKTVQVPLGQGDFGFEKLAAAVRETKWAGWLIDEEGGGPQGADTAAVAPDRSYFRKIFGV